MKRKMTFFAFAGKCVFFGARAASRAMSDDSAMEPTPTPHRLKK